MPYTQEQLDVINSQEPQIRVRAFAGTGKTTTIVGYTRAREDVKFLYACFNRSIAQEARQKFARNVDCKTTHALAFPNFGTKYKHKLGSLRAFDVSKLFRLSYLHSKLAMETLRNYLISADDVLSMAHLPPDADKKNFTETNNALEGARELWKRMQDVSNRDVPMEHDGYLKLFALSKPQLDYDCVLFDEAQDANPVTLGLLAGHKGARLTVGDSYQSIYGFRGAFNALDAVPCDAEYRLTQSFRFGRGIANVANLCLYWHGEKSRIVGAGSCQNSRFEIDCTKPYAQIGRTNMAVLGEAFAGLAQNKLYHFVGGVEGYRLTLIEDGFRLFAGQRAEIKDRFLQQFYSLDALSQYAKEANDVEMSLLVQIVETYQGALPKLVQQLRERSIDEIRNAHRVFSTTHKAKGLEFDSVEMLPDFADLVDGGQLIDREEIDPQEVNLMYVAATRARESLRISPQLAAYWDHMRVIWKKARATQSAAA